MTFDCLDLLRQRTAASPKDEACSVLDNSLDKARILGLSKRLQVDYGVGYSIIHAIAAVKGNKL